VLLSVEGTDTNQLDAGQEIMLFASVLSHCSLIRNLSSKPTGVLGLFLQGEINCWFSIFRDVPADQIVKATKDINGD
jgi:hypothetical protein